MISQIFTRARGLVAALAHEVGCGPVYNPDRVRVYENCNRVKKLAVYLVVSIRRFS
jgi:hypothetical protein